MFSRRGTLEQYFTYYTCNLSYELTFKRGCLLLVENNALMIGIPMHIGLDFAYESSRTEDDQS